MRGLRDRIAAVLREHVEDQLTNYDAGRNECGCGNQGLSGYVEHVADAVIAELGLKSQWINDGIISDGPPPNWWLPCDIRYTTEWERSE